MFSCKKNYLYKFLSITRNIIFNEVKCLVDGDAKLLIKEVEIIIKILLNIVVGFNVVSFR